MPPARPRSTKLMNNMINKGKLKNSKIQSAPGPISPESCNPLFFRKNFNMRFTFTL